MSDLQLAIDGWMAQQGAVPIVQSTAALARACSIFLRKMVIGDRGDRRTRLLNDDICRTAELSFDRIHRITDRIRLDLTPVDMIGGYFQLTKLNETTSVPEAVHNISVGPQRLDISIEWPLPGMVNWTEQPTHEAPWGVKAEGLFDPQSIPKLDCDAWLGQQLVIFDGRGISLKKVISVTASTEAAHSPPISRLMQVGDEGMTRVVQNREIHTLSNIRVCGIKYNHVVVIESALYLYRALARNRSIKRPEGEVTIPTICFVPTDVFSPDQDWLRFDGGLAISLGGTQQSVSHRIRAPR